MLFYRYKSYFLPFFVIKFLFFIVINKLTATGDTNMIFLTLFIDAMFTNMGGFRLRALHFDLLHSHLDYATPSFSAAAVKPRSWMSDNRFNRGYPFPGFFLERARIATPERVHRVNADG